MKDKDFVEKVYQCADQNAALALFKENGVPVTAEELAGLGSLIKAFNDNDGELPDEVAEQVAGGGFDMNNLGKVIGAIGDFLKALENPINTLISIFGGDSSSGGGSGGSGGQQ